MSASASRWTRIAGRLALAAGLVYAGALALLTWRQEALLFHPQTLPADHRFDLGSDVHETWVDVPGARLNALHLRLPQPDGVVLYLHGNAGNLASWFTDLGAYRRANVDLFMIDYRGYGKSSGRIDSEAQLHADVRAAWDLIAPRYEGRRRTVMGISLGSGLAAALAAEVKPEMTVLVSPYVSMLELARLHYRWVPEAIVRYPLRTDQALPRVAGPLLLIHGERDELIPPSHSQRLAALAAQARLVIVPGAGHNDIDATPQYRDELAAALRGR